MSDLTSTERRKLEQLLGMGSGYVLNFSNRTFDDFFFESVGRSIYDPQYDYGSGSKANRLRGFWKVEGNSLVGKVMGEMLDHALDLEWLKADDPRLEECRRTVERIRSDGPVVELDALTAISDERDFDAVAKAVREAIEKNAPEAGLDRLHTFVIKYVRSLCAESGITVTRDKALHSLFGEYVKFLRENGRIESEMTHRILKSSISTLEAFNDVRNNQSLARDNPILNYDEALLIFNHVASSIRFLRGLQGKLPRRDAAARSEEEQR
jgi:hypothetical protein